MTNIWTAASEGDLARVQTLVESGISPSAQDENTYTPLHAAASWAHVDVLRYLVAQGGDMNTVDADGESPLFVVETAEMARVVVGLGGNAAHVNAEGNTAAQNLEEDYPHISLYLRSITGEAQPAAASNPVDPNGEVQPDLETPTNDLLLRVRSIMEASERGELSSIEVDERLREVVEEVVNGQVEAGREIGEGQDADGNFTTGTRDREDRGDELDPKRSRMDSAGR